MGGEPPRPADKDCLQQTAWQGPQLGTQPHQSRAVGLGPRPQRPHMQSIPRALKRGSLPAASPASQACTRVAMVWLVVATSQ